MHRLQAADAEQMQPAPPAAGFNAVEWKDVDVDAVVMIGIPPGRFAKLAVMATKLGILPVELRVAFPVLKEILLLQHL